MNKLDNTIPAEDEVAKVQAQIAAGSCEHEKDARIMVAIGGLANKDKVEATAIGTRDGFYGKQTQVRFDDGNESWLTSQRVSECEKPRKKAKVAK